MIFNSLIDDLKNLAESILQSVNSGEFPKIYLPDRSSRNIHFSKEKNKFVIGPLKSVKDSKNPRMSKNFLQFVWVAYYVYNLLKNNKTSSLRDMYYSSKGVGIDFKDQDESDRIVSDLEAYLGVSRESFGIFPEERSTIFGDLLIEYNVSGFKGKRVNLLSNPDGFAIGASITSSKLIRTNAELILAVESGGMFSRLIEERIWEKMNAILIHLGGQAPRSARRMIKRLTEEFGIDCYIFTDADPWGMHIANVIVYGSKNSVHIPDLITPSAKWIGVYASDIEKYSLPSLPLNEKDLKKIDELLHDPRYVKEPWHSQLLKFRELRKRAEQQALSRWGLSFVTKYLEDKIL